jgi:hypothetical protein
VPRDSVFSSRAVLVTRPSARDLLIAEHGTREQAVFALGDTVDFAELDDKADQETVARQMVLAAIPSAWRRAEIDRSDLDRFLFTADDVILVVGQDGLVANVARFLNEQPVIGFNPDRHTSSVLARHAPDQAAALIAQVECDQIVSEERVMVSAELDDGQQLTCLNEVFVGHQSHQSARYRLSAFGQEERQSSSGVIIMTGTGATGWGRSIHQAHRSRLALPDPDEPTLAFYVREAWPSNETATQLVEGRLSATTPLKIVSELPSQGTIFGDGIETDRLTFAYGHSVTIRVAERRLHLVIS